MKDKKILSELRLIASQLPIVTTREKVRVHGSEILKNNPDAKDEIGEPVSAHKYYHISADMRRNHYRAMKKIYQSGGIDAVNAYIKIMNEIVMGKNKMMEEVIGGISERAQSFKL